MEEGDRVLRDKETMFLLGLKETSFRHLKKDPSFPKAFLIHGNVRGRSFREVMAWIEARKALRDQSPEENAPTEPDKAGRRKHRQRGR